jgi:hypothetical protein
LGERGWTAPTNASASAVVVIRAVTPFVHIIEEGEVTHVHRVAALVLLTACAKGDNRSNDSAAALSAVPNAAPAVQAPQTRRTGPADLTKPLDQYTGDELFALANGQRYTGGNTRNRPCRGPACIGVRARTTRVNVEALVGEDSVGGGNIGPFGTIVSRGRNLGQEPDAMYGMLPGNRYMYFLIVFADTGGTARWQIEQLEINGNTRAHSALATGRVQYCDHPFQRGPRADFRTCAQDGVVRQASFLQGSGDPWWFNCMSGCCVADT